MKVKVSNISNKWRPVKIGLEEGFNMVVVTQAIESASFNGISITPGKTLKLNLNSDQKNKLEWLNVLTEGNIIDVQLRQTGRTLGIDKYQSPRLIRKVEGGTHAEDM